MAVALFLTAPLREPMVHTRSRCGTYDAAWATGGNMPRFRKVLCPIDFDDNSLLALRTASEIARAQKSVLVLLHVVEIPAGPEVALRELYT